MSVVISGQENVISRMSDLDHSVTSGHEKAILLAIDSEVDISFETFEAFNRARSTARIRLRAEQLSD